MQHIQEDLGIAADAIEELTALTVNGNGVLTKQASTTPRTVYNVTATGRKLIAETLEDGVDFGPGIGDLNESALHRIGVQYLCHYLEQEYAQSRDRIVKHYHKLPSNEVIDAVVVEQGEVVVAAEMECHNNDVGGADSSCRSTYRKLQNLDVEEALWVFETGDHWVAVNNALATAHSDPDSPIEFRDSGYGRSTISKGFARSYPGMTEALTLSTLVRSVEYPLSLYQHDLRQFQDN